MKGQRRTVEEYLDGLGSARAVANAAALVLEGEWPDDVADDDHPSFGHGLLRWAVSESPRAIAAWSAIAASGGKTSLADRDRYVLDLWQALATHESHAPFREEYFERWKVRQSYERHLFHWFLSRLDLPSALGLFSGRFPPRVFYPGVLVVVAGSLAIRFFFFGHTVMGTWVLGGGLLLIALAGGFLFRWPGYAYVQAMVPRLGAAVGIGYLFLLASPEVMTAVAGWPQPIPVQLAAGGAVVVLVWAYGALEVERRVEPPPAWPKAVIRTLPVVTLGLAHTLAALGLLVPLLEAVLTASSPGAPTAPLAAHDLFLFAAIALALGVVLELAWAERPITEPLG